MTARLQEIQSHACMPWKNKNRGAVPRLCKFCKPCSCHVRWIASSVNQGDYGLSFSGKHIVQDTISSHDYHVSPLDIQLKLLQCIDSGC